MACADDGYIKAKMSETLQVLADLKHVLKEDAGLDLNVSKQQAACDVAQQKINSRPSLAALSGNVSLASFCPEGFLGIGVPIGTYAFIQHCVAKTCRVIIDDVEKLNAIEVGFNRYQLLRFCQATLTPYHIVLNRCTLQQQHVDYKIA